VTPPQEKVLALEFLSLALEFLSLAAEFLPLALEFLWVWELPQELEFFAEVSELLRVWELAKGDRAYLWLRGEKCDFPGLWVRVDRTGDRAKSSQYPQILRK
jgi:hypothetical protein